MPRIIEAEAIISGKDAGLAKVLTDSANKMKGLAAAADAVTKGSGGMSWGAKFSKDLDKVGASAKQIEIVRASWEKLQASMRGTRGAAYAPDNLDAWKRQTLSNLRAVEGEMGRMHRLRSNPAVRAGVGAAAAVAGAYATRRIAGAAIHAAAEGGHERARMDVAGLTESEMKEAEEASAKLSSKYKPLTQTSILHSLRNIRSVVGTFEEATHIIDPLLKLRVVAEGAHPERAAELTRDFDQLIKGMEIKGVTQDMPKFVHYMDGMAKALNVFGDTLRPTDYYEMFKYGRQATQNLSDEFMLKTAPTLAQELGGSGAGTALSSFYQTVVGGRMKASAANELNRMGLIGDQSKVHISKAGIVDRVQPGAILNSRLAASDPFAWVHDVMLPALAKKGITSHEAIQDEIASIFRDRTAAQMVGIFATQESRIKKDWSLVGNAKGLDSADTFMSKDPITAWKSVTSQFENMLQVAASPLVAPAGAAMQSIAAGLSSLANAAREHPAAGAAGLVAGGAATAGAGWWGATALRNWWQAKPIPGVWGARGLSKLAPGLGTAAALYEIYDKQKDLPDPREAISPDAMPHLVDPRSGRLGMPSRPGGVFEVPPAKAEINGQADLNVKVTVDSGWLKTFIETSIKNSINAFRSSGAAPSGTSGSTGATMPEAAPQ